MAMDMAVALKISAGVTGQQAVDQLRTSMDRLNGAASQVGRGFDMAKTAVVGFLGLQAVQGIFNMGTALINTADRLNDMAQQTGYTVEQLSSLEYAAKLSGTSLDAVQAAMSRLSAKAVEAATGNKQAALAFQALDVNVKNAQGTMRSSVDIMADVGDALADITDNTLRTAVAREIFGKNADALVPFLMNMREAQNEAQQLGAVMGGDFASKAAEFNDNLDRLGFQLRGIGNTIVGELLPGMNTLAESMLRTSDSGGALQLIANGIRIAFEALVVVGGNLIYVFKQMGAEAVGIGKQMAALATLDFDGFNKIGEQMRRDAELARKEIDAWSESILNANKKMAGAGRGFVNPENVKSSNDANQRAVAILKQLSDANRKLTDEEREAARQEKERQQVLQGLSDEVTKLVQGEEELTIAKLRRLGAGDREIAQARALMRERAGLLAADRELDAATRDQMRLEEDAKRKKQELAAAGKAVFEETRTPAEKLNIELARLNDLLDKGVINWDTYSRAVFNAQEEFDNAGAKGKDTMSELQQAIEGWGRQAADVFVQFAFTGKATFKDFVNSVLQDIARMLIYKNVTKPLFDAISTVMPKFANGGIMTDSGPLPLQAYATGGIANSPQLALFGEGRMPEAYVPLPDGRSIPVTMQGGGGTNVVVNVNMETGQTQAQSDDKQGTDLGLVIASVVKQELINQRRPGGILAA